MNLRRHMIWLLVTACVAAAPAYSQQTTQLAARAVFSARDLSGVWAKPSGGRGRGRTEELPEKRETEQKTVRPESAWSSEKLPFTAEGRAAFEANKPTGGPRQVKSQVSANDPRDAGNPLGLYRAIEYSGNGRPFEIGTLNGNVVQLLAVGRIWRTIYTDGRPVPKEVATGPFWYGYSVGHWEGDTLVVITQALDERQWLDAWGTPISMEARIEERWRRVATDELQLTITINDPAYYTKPWTSLPESFRRQPKNIEPEEIIYAPIDIQGYNEETLLPSSTTATQ
jgi:hypothetical protein